MRFSDEICFDDDSSSSLDAKARYRGWDDDDGHGGSGGGGGKIVRARGAAGVGGLSGGELRKGVWFRVGVCEFWVRENEAEFGVRRWRMFGTKLDS